jgi:hypothetical protein
MRGKNPDAADSLRARSEFTSAQNTLFVVQSFAFFTAEERIEPQEVCGGARSMRE